MCLRYFGSKSWLKKRLDELIPSDISVLVSPFLGSGKAEYYLLKRRPDMTLLGSDSFDSLVNFHQRILDGSILDSLRKCFLERVVCKEEHRDILEALSDPWTSPEHLAAFFFVVQYFSFNGKFGTYAKQFPITEKTLSSIELHSNLKAFVHLKDAIQAIQEAPNGSIIYADPPYLMAKGREKYYAKTNMGNFEFQKSLANALQTRGLPFILSTNDNPEVLKLYPNCVVETISRDIRVGSKRRVYNEILLISRDSWN